MEYYAFVHFSVNTYTDMSWGFGNEDPNIFNPSQLDCMQWARICKEAGMKGIIITAKHHSGFCLWPSKFTEYSVKNCPWKNGKGDIVREMSDACKAYGLKLGIYLSPWDRNSADYGKPEYITYFRNQLKELLTNYGDIFEIWFDGANGGSGYYGGANETRKIDATTYYDWANTYKMIRELQPNIVIWNDGGDRADLRWVGTEAGYIGETNWSLLNKTGDVPEEMLRHGVENGNAWVPGEVNTSIRPEWFYHPKEDGKVKTLPQLMDIYYNSIGRNATLLMNSPIMPNGLINGKDEKAALDFAHAVKAAFAINLAKNAPAKATNIRGKNAIYNASKVTDGNKNSYWSTDDSIKSASITIDFGKAVSFNRFLVQEYIALGQRVKAFSIEAWVKGEWKLLDKQTTIGYKRILRFPTVSTTKLRFTVLDAKACPLISNIEVYKAPQILTPPLIIRGQSGKVRIIPADPESEIFYTLDGSLPTRNAGRYTGLIETDDGKTEVKAMAYNAVTGKSSTVTVEQFDISKKQWKILGTADSNANAILDGLESTSWHQQQNTTAPVDLVIDLGQTEKLAGFRYLSDQNWWASDIVTNYAFYISNDNNQWQLVASGEFANIKNNPLWQTNRFKPTNARYIKLSALHNIQNNNAAGYAEIDIITE
jgi:alpha-L-fucosidase